MKDDASSQPGKLIPLPQGVLRFGAFRFDMADSRLYRGDIKVHLTPKAADVLAYLLAGRGKIVSKDEFFDAVWNGVHVSDESLTQAVSMIRQALGDLAKHPEYIETVTGRGYRFIASASAEPVAPVVAEPPHLVAAPDPSQAGSLRSEAHARDEVEGAGGPSAEAGAGLPAVGIASPAVGWSRTTRAVAVGVAVVAMVTGGLAARNLMVPAAPAVPTAPLIKMPMALQPGTHLWGGGGSEPGTGDRPSRTAFDVTPDGDAVVFAATDGASSKLYLRRVGEFEPIPIAGTDGASCPFVSPDGTEVGFVLPDEIRIVSIEGGEPRRVLQDAPFGSRPNGVSWTDDWIVFAGDGGRIFRVAAGGGVPEPLTEPRPDADRHLHPRLLPGGKTLLYTRQKTFWVWETSEIVVQPIGGEPVVLVDDGADARYLPTGHLLFARRGTLMAASLDLETLELGDPLVVVNDVMQAVNGSTYGLDSGAAQFSIAPTGALAYATGGTCANREEPPLWIDRDGNAEPVPGTARDADFAFARLSPDSTKLVYRTVYSNAEHDITIRDLETGETRKLPLKGRQGNAVWSPDGKRLTFVSNHEGPNAFYWIGADLDLGNLHRVTENRVGWWLTDWSTNDELLYWHVDGLWVVDAAGETEPRKVHDRGESPTFSPDGRWLAYLRAGQIQVSSYPGGSDYRITTEGGTSPAWSRDGSELFFRRGTKMMAVRITGDDDVFRFEAPYELFDRPTQAYGPVRSYDVADDGRFLMLECFEHPRQAVTEIKVVLNWFEELRRLVRTGR